MTGTRAIQELLTAGETAWQKVDKWLEGKSFPLIEGPHVTWIWRGNADGVNLRHWIFGLESDSALARVPHTDLWYITLDIPHGSRV